MTNRSAVHATFCIDNVYDAAPARVFKAFSDRAAKDRWFGGPDEWEKGPREMDFRVGGRETSNGGPKGGLQHHMTLIYQDIVPNERIVYSYDMALGDNRISVSLACIEFKPEGQGTRLILTEHGVYLDGYDDAGSREHGTRWLLGKMGDSLRSETV